MYYCPRPKKSVFCSLWHIWGGFYHRISRIWTSYIFCKLFNIEAPSFSIGFGPQLISKKIGETVFSLSAIPLGGYVEIAGASEEQGPITERSFMVKPWYPENARYDWRYQASMLYFLMGALMFIVYVWYAPISHDLSP